MARKYSEDEKISIQRRLVIAYSSLPRENGELPGYDSLEKKYELTSGHIGKLLSGERTVGDAQNLERVARAFRTTTDYILFGRGGQPEPTGPLHIPTRKRSGNQARVPAVAMTARTQYEHLHGHKVEPDWMERAVLLASTFAAEQPEEWWLGILEMIADARRPTPTPPTGNNFRHMPRRTK